MCSYLKRHLVLFISSSSFFNTFALFKTCILKFYVIALLFVGRFEILIFFCMYWNFISYLLRWPYGKCLHVQIAFITNCTSIDFKIWTLHVQICNIYYYFFFISKARYIKKGQRVTSIQGVYKATSPSKSQKNSEPHHPLDGRQPF